MDVFPSFWKRLEHLIGSGRLVTTEVVLYELEKQDDELSQWAKRQGSLFIPLDTDIQLIAIEILDKYPRLVKKVGVRTEADSFVIALARKLGHKLITEEFFGSEAKPKIPFVCSNYGIETMNILAFMRELGWSF